MKYDKFKNKSKSRFLPENEKHGKKEPKRHRHRQEAKVKKNLKDLTGYVGQHYPDTKDYLIERLFEEESKHGQLNDDLPDAYDVYEFEEFDEPDIDKFEKLG